MATIGYGGKIRADGDEFLEVTSITVPQEETNTVESTHLQSPGRRKEYVDGLIEPGEASFEQNYSAAEFTRVLGLKGDTLEYEIDFPDGLRASFDGILTKCEVDLAVEDIVKITNTVKVTGPVTVGMIPTTTTTTP